MVHDDADVPAGPASLDSVRVQFDEQRLVSDAGLLLTATLAERLGIEELVNESVWLGYRVPGAALPGRKVMSLVHGMLAGADSIDDMNVLRAGSTGLVLGHRVMAPSTLGTFLRAFTFGHVRQLDHVLDMALERVWEMGAGPGDGPLVIDIDSFVGEVHGDQKQGASYGYTRQLGYHPILAVRSDTGEVLHIRNRKGKANTQRGAARFVDELLARVRRAGHTATIVIRADIGFENHKQFTALARQGVELSIGVKQSKHVRALIADVDHRDHATIELVIRDLKDQALKHFPSGRYPANSAWTVIAALAHNLGRWTTQIGLPNRPVQTARSRRRHLLQIPARLTRTSRQWTLRMPARWPWQNDFTTILEKIRALPALT